MRRVQSSKGESSPFGEKGRGVSERLGLLLFSPAVEVELDGARIFHTLILT